jgi:tetratricopeptide (TPR) repeat protein
MYRDALEMLKLHPNQGIVENQQKYVAVYAELGDLENAKIHWNKCLELDPEWSASKLNRLASQWNFEKPFWQRYMQSFAKAGHPL